jgi:catechol 2,3-dioxygenase-like lactoylglutathione lyase family enzyme
VDRAKLIGIAPQLVVADVKITAEYYQNILGFRILGLVADPPVYAMVERDGIQVHFAKSGTQEIKTNKDYRSISHDFIIWVPEIDKFFNELKAKNAKIIEGIVERVYGSREFVIEDCDGRKILIGD